jgi:hypothetical protein
MKFIEIYFNPQNKKYPDSIFNSFCHEPQNIYEKKLGYFFVVGEMKNPLPSTVKLLSETTSQLKETYYLKPARLTPEKSFKEALKNANSFLEKKVKSGQVNWLGNFNVAVISIVPQKRDKFDIFFTKTGNIKILLLREDYYTDIGKNLDMYEIEPYPLQIFGNIITGKLSNKDKIIILTDNIFNYFNEEKILTKISKATNINKSYIKNIINDKDVSHLEGICVICSLKDAKEENYENEKIITFQKEKEKFSLIQFLKKTLKNLYQSSKPFINSISFKNNFTVSKNIKNQKNNNKIKKVPIKIKIKGNYLSKKNIFLIVAFLIIILLGLLLF